ncbi:hypothetical protein PENPOL_c002G05786 [Penicillium polonicum]|uniref:Cytochrome c oxidase copper chaperone n=1 Tax=Penicillium polonicum TaxID=60169 RepID=A0A1V6NXP0_PENPO|nr:hypothetical protein PENPOL_c002G05786 [Penicillium polonicum]
MVSALEVTCKDLFPTLVLNTSFLSFVYLKIFIKHICISITMSWLFGSSNEKSAAAPEQAPAQPAQSEKPKPCCVCKPEKTARDDCMLFSKSDNPEQECKSTIEQYKTCMAGFGFKV